MTVDELIARLRGALEKAAGVRFAVLFGSAAVDPDRAHDVDVGASFEAGSPSWQELGRMEAELETAVGRDVDIVDLDDASTVLRWEVVSRGKLIVAPHREAWLDFQARVPIEMADLRPYLERESAGLRRSLGV